jgi:hypothetical protein
MITLQQMVDIPSSRRLHLDLDLPEAVPSGEMNVLLVFPVGEKPAAPKGPARPRYDFKPLPTTEEVLAEAHRKFLERRASGRKAFEGLYGCMPGAFGGDGVKYQREIRDEWPD